MKKYNVMDKFLFSIENIALFECHFKLNPDFKFSGKPTKIDTAFKIDYMTRKQDLQVILSISSDSSGQPFIFTVVLGGGFKFEKMPTKSMLERLANINCASILFPYVRETVADLTRRAGLPPFHMSPVNFVELFEEKKKKSAGVVRRKTAKKA